MTTSAKAKLYNWTVEKRKNINTCRLPELYKQNFFLKSKQNLYKFVAKLRNFRILLRTYLHFILLLVKILEALPHEGKEVTIRV